MKMENKHEEKDRSEDHKSLHLNSGHSERVSYDGDLLPDDIGDTNELVDESAQVTSKQSAVIMGDLFFLYPRPLTKMFR